MQPLITISNNIKLTINELSPRFLNSIKNDLTMIDPAYNQSSPRWYSTRGKTKFIKLYRFEGGDIILPRGYSAKLWQRINEHNVNASLSDNRLLLERIDFKSKIKLRDYQVPAVEELVVKNQGGVVAGCGAGKTQIMLEAMARIGQPALWICHSYELLEQTMKRACEVFEDMEPEEIGIIAAGNVLIGKRLTMALVQTLSKLDIDTIKDNFGSVFIDEAHRLAAKSFFNPVSQFPAKYRLWASATPEREDGLTEMVFMCGGPILHTVQQSELPTIIPKLILIETNYKPYKDIYVKVISNLIRNEERNSILVETIAKEAPGHFSLVLSDRKEHLDILKDALAIAAPNLRTAILTGSQSHKIRADTMKRIQNKEIDLLFATQLAREGLDITHLDRLFLVTPKRAAGAITQEVGRIMRPCPGKSDAIVFDFWDSKNPILRSQFWKRHDTYMQLGMVFSMNKFLRSRCKA